MKTIVDQHGKPFKPSPMERLLTLAQATLVLQPASAEPANSFDIAQLRQSCGAPPKTITFRRYSPLAEKTP